MKKNLPVIILVAVLICAAVAIVLLVPPRILYEYKVKPDGTAEITNADETIQDADIPAELDGYKVTSIGDSAFSRGFQLRTITIPEGVEAINGTAFLNCWNLKSISIPDSLVSITDRPFMGSTYPSVTISQDHPVFAVENKALINKKDMTLISFLDGEDTGTYEIAQGIRKIGAGAFESSKLSSIVIPDSVEIIGWCAMDSCTNLTEIVIPDSVKRIEQYVFMDCPKLKPVHIPASVTAIGTNAFYRCNQPTISPDNPAFEIIDRFLVHRKNREITEIFGERQDEYTIPEGIRAISGGLFRGFRNPVTVFIPDSVTKIPADAFDANTVIKAHAGSAAQKYCEERSIPFEETAAGPADGEEKPEQASGDSEQELYRYNLEMNGTAEITGVNNREIESVEIPAEVDGYPVSAIGYGAFANCEQLRTVVIPEGVEKITASAFDSCENLKSVSLPDSLVSISGQIFDYCPNLKKVEISPDHPVFAVENNALINKQDMTLMRYLDPENNGVYEVEKGIRTIGAEAFSYTKVSSVILPEELRSIGSLAFSGCQNLKEIVIPEGVIRIGNQVFCNCYNLVSAEIPKSLTDIDSAPFAYCHCLESIRVSPGNPAYEVVDQMLVEKQSRRIVSAAGTISGKYEIPAGIREIGARAFQGCEKITELVVPNSVTVIDEGAFTNCFALQELILPASVRTFGNISSSWVFVGNNEDMVIKAPAGSAAEKYCEKNEIKFEVLK